jgi:predicted ATP-grasp superfamily ATP-dependent carboligase
VGGSLNSLGVVRSLSAGGMRIYMLDTTKLCAAGWSRHCSFIRSSGLQGRPLVDELVSLASRLECRPVLILTRDDSVDTVSRYREILEPLYRFSLPSPSMLQTLADKVQFQHLAEREGLEVPRAATLARDTSAEVLGTLVPPMILKPADSKLQLHGLVERIVLAESQADAQSAAAHMLTRAPQIIVQEWIEGPDDAIFFTLFSCDRSGKVLGMFCGRKLVCTSPGIGSTAVCVSAPEVADQLIGRTERYIKCVSYCGLGSLEFKRSTRTGQFLIIEPTVGRTDWQEEIATLCGTNLPLLAYLAELDGAVLQSHSKSGTDLPGPVIWRSSAGYRVSRELRGPGRKLVDGYFRWTDPMPALLYYAGERFAFRVLARLARLASYVRRRVA